MMRLSPRRYGTTITTVSEAVSIWAKIIGWWERDEVSGTTMLDSHTNALHGTYSGLTVNQSPLATNLGKSVTFPVGNNYADVPDNALLKPTGNLSAMIWIKRNGVQAADFPKLLWKPALNNVGGHANYQFCYEKSSGLAFFRVNISGAYNSSYSTTTIADATTYFLTGTKLGTSLKMYLNANLEGTITTGSGAIDTVGESLRWGYKILPDKDNWVGSQDQTAVFNDALTQAEITYLYNGGAGVSYAQMKSDSGN
jgi:hypothetical protein